MKYDHMLLFAVAILAVAVGQILGDTTSDIARFLHGALLRVSVGCTVLGLALYMKSSRKV
jgi:hypothetical protein